MVSPPSPESTGSQFCEPKPAVDIERQKARARLFDLRSCHVAAIFGHANRYLEPLLGNKRRQVEDV